MKEKEFYLVKELSEELRVCEMTIYRYINSGKLSAHKIGKEFRIGKDDYNDFLNSVKTSGMKAVEE